MEIQSALASGLQGFQKAQGDVTEAAEDIAANLAVSPEDFGIGQENNTDNAPSPDTASKNASSAESPDLTKAVVDLKVAEFQAKAYAIRRSSITDEYHAANAYSVYSYCG
jgi:hypothetical protein